MLYLVRFEPVFAADLGLITPSGMLIYAQQADGRLAATPQIVSAIPHTTQAEPVDWNGDGLMDLALWYVDPSATERFTSLRIYLQDTGGAFTLGATAAHPKVPANLAVGDVTGDGRPDLAVVYPGGRPFGTVTIYPQAPDGSLGAPQRPITDSHGQPASIVISDLNGDGRSDILVLTSDLGSFLLTQNSTGTLDMFRDWPIGARNIPRVNSTALIDDDGDGFSEVIGLVMPYEGIVFIRPLWRVYLPGMQLQ